MRLVSLLLATTSDLSWVSGELIVICMVQVCRRRGEGGCGGMAPTCSEWWWCCSETWNINHQQHLSDKTWQTSPVVNIDSMMIIVFETDHLRCYQRYTSLLDIISQIRLCLLLADPSSGYNICYGWGKDKMNIKSAGDCHCKLMSGILRGHKHWKRQDFLDCSLRWSVAWKGCVAFNLWSEWLYSSPFISHIIKLILRFKSPCSAWLIVNNGWEEMMTAWLELVVVIPIL